MSYLIPIFVGLFVVALADPLNGNLPVGGLPGEGSGHHTGHHGGRGSVSGPIGGGPGNSIGRDPIPFPPFGGPGPVIPPIGGFPTPSAPTVNPGGPIQTISTPSTPFINPGGPIITIPTVNPSSSTPGGILLTLPTIKTGTSSLSSDETIKSSTPLPTDIFRPRFKRACTNCVGHHGLCVIGEGNCYAPDGCYFCGGCGPDQARCQDPSTEPCQCYQ